MQEAGPSDVIVARARDVWPRMRRVEHDHDVSIDRDAGVVTVRHSDARTLLALVERSCASPLSWFTVPMTLVDECTATRPYLAGVSGDDVDQAGLEGLVCALHRAGRDRHRVATSSEVMRSLYRRVIYRAQRNCPGAWPTIVSWSGWSRLLDRAYVIGPWHGDPTAYNAVVTSDGRTWLIDHSAQSEGILDYDIAKTRRHLLVDNDLRLRSEPREWRRDPMMICIVAGMIGSHGAPELIELFKELTG